LHFVVSAVKSTAARRLSNILQCGPHPQMSLRPLLYAYSYTRSVFLGFLLKPGPTKPGPSKSGHYA